VAGRPAARLRQDHHAGARGRQGHQAGNDLRPHPHGRYALRGAARDREIAALRRKLETRDPKEHAAIDADLAAATAQLDDDRAFLRRANVGGEGMRPEDQARVAQIAAYRWTGPDGRSRISCPTTKR
jgi:hypothetical protein